MGETMNSSNTANESEMIPLIYFDKEANKTIVKFEASKRDKKKVDLIKHLNEVRKYRNQAAKVLEKVLKMYDVVNKEKLEKQKISSPRIL